MNRRKLATLSVSTFFIMMLAALPLITACAAQPTPTDQPSPTAPPIQTLKAILVQPVDLDEMRPALEIIRRVNERTRGELFIEIVGGPEAIPSFEQHEAMRTGIVDVHVGYAAYYQTLLPEAMAMSASRLTVQEERDVGAYDLWVKIFREKANAQFLARLNGPSQFYVYSNVLIEDPREDFKGVLLRGTQMYQPFVERLGGKIAVVPYAEVYSAMERGVVDGFLTAIIGVRSQGFHEVTKYVFDAPFYHGNISMYMNVDVWDKLPKHVQDVYQEAALEVEEWVGVHVAEYQASEMELLKHYGLIFNTPSAADRKWFQDIVYDATWDWAVENGPEYGDQLRALCDPGGS